ncbi:DUF3833 domain-containing protein [Gynuella sunshinyii]|nr:DUF3833 domain-containing protein [Gynuella sunshinyii]
MLRLLTIAGVLIMLSSCSNKLSYYENTEPKLAFDEYFSGNLNGWGLVQNWKGQVVRRFDIKMTGSWQGDKGELHEQFHYYDGEDQQRVWRIQKLDDGSFEGRADDILGPAVGASNGNAINWHYVIDLPVGGKVYRVKFDDWMWLMNDGVLINRSYIKKFGITVAELTIFIQRAKPE